MADTPITLQKRGFLATLRTDRWWVEPLLVLCGLGAFIIYATWAAFQGTHYWFDAGVQGFGGYLSPFYSPVVYTDVGAAGSAPLYHALLGSWPEWWPSWFPASPAFIILIFPLSFRFTCYYYRGAYYKAFAGTPPACAVGSIPRKPGKYRGESFIMVFQNLHRYTLYVAIIFIPILYADAIAAFFRGGQFGVGVGSIILLTNATLLACYTFGCHSWRHLIGGRKDCFSCSGAGRIGYGVYQKVSWLNRRHKLFAWASLVFVGFSDFYVRMVSSGVITDLNTWG
ncbi:MAG: hypothetical protein R3301_06490 [Saprospiraceae bacterium]|nr:hypothetical protein [Saprospiraceae bacterium]